MPTITVTPLNTILSWFQTDDFPTELQFANAWSSFWHKTDKLPISSIEGLTQLFQQTASSQAFTTHLSDKSAHAGSLALLDASNLKINDVSAWKDKLKINQIEQSIITLENQDDEMLGLIEQLQNKSSLQNIISDDKSLLIDVVNENIESNVSVFSQEYPSLAGTIIVTRFEIIEILGIYDSGLRLNSTEYQILAPTRVEIAQPRRGTYLEIQYTHLKTDN